MKALKFFLILQHQPLTSAEILFNNPKYRRSQRTRCGTKVSGFFVNNWIKTMIVLPQTVVIDHSKENNDDPFN